MDSTSTIVSARTIQRALHESGYSGYKGARKPFVNETNRKKRLCWAKQRKNWESEWENIILYGAMNYIFVCLMGMAEYGCGDNQKKGLIRIALFQHTNQDRME